MPAGKLEKVEDIVEEKQSSFKLPCPMTIRRLDELSQEEIEQLKVKAVDYEPTKSCSMLLTDDMRCNYVCGSKGTEGDFDMKDCKGELVDENKIDYNIIKEEKVEKGDFDKRDSISYMKVTSVEEGEEWYRQNFPKVPEDLYQLMSRWSFGDLSETTKKSIKNKKKKDLKKKNKEPQGLQVEKGNFVVTF